MTSLTRIPACFALATALALTGLVPDAAARSRAADRLVQEQIAAGCGEGTGGQFAPGAVIERDLTGDGRDDLIISHEGLTCGSAGRSAFCGMRTCAVLLYVREGDLLRKQKDVLSIGVSVTSGDPPAIQLTGNDFQPRTMRWNGRSFVFE